MSRISPDADLKAVTRVTNTAGVTAFDVYASDDHRFSGAFTAPTADLPDTLLAPGAHATINITDGGVVIVSDGEPVYTVTDDSNLAGDLKDAVKNPVPA